MFLKTQKKLKELESFNQNAIYTCISWYSKIRWISLKNCWCQQNSMGVSRDSYIFWFFFRQGVTVPSFIILGYVLQILGKETFCPPYPSAVPKNPWIELKHLWKSVSKVYQTKMIMFSFYLHLNWFAPLH